MPRGRYGKKLAVDPTLVLVDRRNASRLTDLTLGRLEHLLFRARVKPVAEATSFENGHVHVMYRLSDVLAAVAADKGDEVTTITQGQGD